MVSMRDDSTYDDAIFASGLRTSFGPLDLLGFIFCRSGRAWSFPISFLMSALASLPLSRWTLIDNFAFLRA
jgi:hypothetical protein